MATAAAPSEMTAIEKLTAIRQLMESYQLEGYLILSGDAHQVEALDIYFLTLPVE